MSNKTPTALEAFFMATIQANGVALPQRPIIDFTGGTVADDPINNRTLVSLSTGAGGAFATLSANYTQPNAPTNAGVLSAVTIQVSISSNFSVGSTIFVPGGGFYTVQSIGDSTHMTVLNLGGPYNAVGGATVTSGVLILPDGPPPLLIQGNDSLAVPQRPTIDFRGFAVTDDAANARTVVAAWAPIFRANHAGSPYTLTLSPWQLNVFADVSGGVITLSPPSQPADGTPFTVNNSAGDASVNNITITRVGGSTDTFQDPNNIGAAPVATVLHKIKGASVTWIYGATEAQWRLE